MLARLLRVFRRRCPACSAPALRTRNWIRATCVDAQGQRYPDSWTYESCDVCGQRFKRYANGTVELPSDDEWQQHVAD